MDFLYWLWVLLLLIAVCVPLGLLYRYGQAPFDHWSKLGVKGPSPTIFLGNQLELFKPGGSMAAHTKWQKLYGQIYGIYNFRRPQLVVTDPEVLRRILVKDFNNFTDRYFSSNGSLINKEAKTGLFFSGGQDWKRIRSIVSPTFSGSKLRGILNHISICADRLVTNLEVYALRGGAADIGKIFSAFSLEVIASTGFGVQVDSQKNLDEPLVAHGQSLFAFRRSLLAIFLSVGIFPDIFVPLLRSLNIGFFKKKDMAYFSDVVGKVVEQRRKNPDQTHSDLLSLLINAEVEEDVNEHRESDTNETLGKGKMKQLSREEVIGQALMFFFAGFETTYKTLQFMCYEIARNRHVQRRLLDEIDETFGFSVKDEEQVNFETVQSMPYMDAVIHETLRMYPPLTQISRIPIQDTAIKGGIHLAANTGILIPIINIQRDPSNHPNPNKFDPTRFIDPDTRKFRKVGSESGVDVFNFLPFGFGPRQCVGEQLAMLEMKVALIHIFRKLTLDPTTSERVGISDIASILRPVKPIMLSPRVRPRFMVKE